MIQASLFKSRQHCSLTGYQKHRTVLVKMCPYLVLATFQIDPYTVQFINNMF